jgi:hypothetical protein
VLILKSLCSERKKGTKPEPLKSEPRHFGEARAATRCGSGFTKMMQFLVAPALHIRFIFPHYFSLFSLQRKKPEKRSMASKENKFYEYFPYGGSM